MLNAATFHPPLYHKNIKISSPRYTKDALNRYLFALDRGFNAGYRWVIQGLALIDLMLTLELSVIEREKAPRLIPWGYGLR